MWSEFTFRCLTIETCGQLSESSAASEIPVAKSSQGISTKWWLRRSRWEESLRLSPPRSGEKIWEMCLRFLESFLATNETKLTFSLLLCSLSSDTHYHRGRWEVVKERTDGRTETGRTPKWASSFLFLAPSINKILGPRSLSSFLLAFSCLPPRPSHPSHPSNSLPELFTNRGWKFVERQPNSSFTLWTRNKQNHFSLTATFLKICK